MLTIRYRIASSLFCVIYLPENRARPTLKSNVANSVRRHLLLLLQSTSCSSWLDQSAALHIGWQRCNFFIPICTNCSGRHNVGQSDTSSKLLLKPTDFKSLDKSSLVNLAKYDIIQHGDRVVTIDYCDVTLPYLRHTCVRMNPGDLWHPRVLHSDTGRQLSALSRWHAITCSRCSCARDGRCSHHNDTVSSSSEQHRQRQLSDTCWHDVT